MVGVYGQRRGFAALECPPLRLNLPDKIPGNFDHAAKSLQVPASVTLGDKDIILLRERAEDIDE